MENARGTAMTATIQLAPKHRVTEVPETGSEALGSCPASVLGKAHLLLAAFGLGHTTLGLTELSRRSGVPKASAHRLAVELVGLGLLARTPQGYQLGWQIYELGQLVPGPARLRATARPALMDLRMATRAVVHLAVPQGLECLYLERLAGRREMALIASVGTRMPSHLTASGRLFLAYAKPESLAGLGTDALDVLGVNHYHQVSQVLSGICERRYSEEQQECVAGFKTFAVPVDYAGPEHVIASISATLPIDRRDDQHVLHALWATSREISQSLTGGGRRRRDLAS
jgi:DNA-binding IclR family transcriptional regulator